MRKKEHEGKEVIRGWNTGRKRTTQITVTVGKNYDRK